MKIDVEITLLESGEVVKYSEKYVYEDSKEPEGCSAEEVINFMWGEGNYACDCNRHLFFERAKEEEDDDSWGTLCGNSRYTVRIFEQGTDRIIYEDSSS